MKVICIMIASCLSAAWLVPPGQCVDAMQYNNAHDQFGPWMYTV